MSVTNQTSLFLNPNFSATTALLKAGNEWTKEGAVKWLGAHSVIPVASIATEALDVGYHAGNSVVTLAIFVARAALYIVSLSFVDIAPSIGLSNVVQHAYRAVGNAPMIAVTPLASFFSCDAALAVLDGLKLTSGTSDLADSESVWTNFWAQEGLGMKVGYLLNHKKDVLYASASCVSNAVAAAGSFANKYKVYLGAVAVAAPAITHVAQKYYFRPDANSTVENAVYFVKDSAVNGYNAVKGFFVTPEEPKKPEVISWKSLAIDTVLDNKGSIFSSGLGFGALLACYKAWNTPADTEPALLKEGDKGYEECGWQLKNRARRAWNAGALNPLFSTTTLAVAAIGIAAYARSSPAAV